MKTATRPDDLEILGHLLQADLQRRLSTLVPIQVRCLLKEGALMILVQHRVDVMLEQQEIFDFLEQTILEHHSSVGNPVKIYLRVAGQKQAYASHSFTTESLSEPIVTADRPVETVENFPKFLNPSAVEEPEDDWAETELSENLEAPTTDSELPHPWDEPISEDEPQPDVWSPETPETEASKPKSKSSLLPLIVAGVGLSLAVFSTSLYVLTRPCVIGVCRAIPEAQGLSEQSTATLQNPGSGKDVLEAQQQLLDAIQILESIPSWSSHHRQAEELLKAYEAQAERVDEMVTALKTAARASYKSQNPPHPASRWIEVQSLWREAIAQLEQLPTKSNLQPLAQQKIKEYKANLAQTNQRLVKERQAQGYINSAKEAALIAEARQGVAQTLPHWQLVYSTWQVAMKRLKQIPQGTTAYEEAQQLSALYLPKMAVARDRKAQEQFATNAYTQGLRIAQLAKNSQSDSQWSMALIHWRNALNYLNQVPNGTFYYAKAQSLISPYTQALKQAQGQLQAVLKLQQARSDLHQTCFGKTQQVCSYTLTSNAIQVRLSPTYMQKVRQTATIAKARGDSNVQAGVVNHILTLGEALEAISDNARNRVDVYNPDGSLIETHMPGL